LEEEGRGLVISGPPNAGRQTWVDKNKEKENRREGKKGFTKAYLEKGGIVAGVPRR